MLVKIINTSTLQQPHIRHATRDKMSAFGLTTFDRNDLHSQTQSAIVSNKMREQYEKLSQQMLVLSHLRDAKKLSVKFHIPMEEAAESLGLSVEAIMADHELCVMLEDAGFNLALIFPNLKPRKAELAPAVVPVNASSSFVGLPAGASSDAPLDVIEEDIVATQPATTKKKVIRSKKTDEEKAAEAAEKAAKREADAAEKAAIAAEKAAKREADAAEKAAKKATKKPTARKGKASVITATVEHSVLDTTMLEEDATFDE
jgi:hypothetical protein